MGELKRLNMEITRLNHIHFVGIKGVGVAALALCAQDLGIKVTGSDLADVFITDKVLEKRKISFKTNFSADNLEPRPDLVVTTGAHGGLRNIEVLAAKKMGIPVLTQGEALAEFAKNKITVAVCGVGGKTTTSAMISYILDKVGLKPSYAVGVSEIFGLGYGGKYDNEGKYFVAEADEYVVSPGVDDRPKFHLLSPKIIVVTNIAHDHPDIYPKIKDTLSAYQIFFEKLPEDGVLVISSEDKIALSMAKKINRKTIIYNPQDFSKKLKLRIPGDYNLRNAIAAVSAVSELGVSPKEATSVLADFNGTKRRFEVVGETATGAIVVDDYAHHPSEIEKLIKAAREFYPGKRITIAFQPHTYSRTKALFDDFAKALSQGDRVCLVDIYSSAREKRDDSVSSERLAEAVKKINQNTFYIGSLENSGLWLKKNSSKGEVLLTVGAGDIFYIHKEILR